MEVWLFILGYLIHFVGSCLLLWRIFKNRSVYGLSLDTQLCFLLSTVSRCIWSFDTRLVETWIAYVELCCSTIISILLVYYLLKLRHTSPKAVEWYLTVFTLAPLTASVALVLHPGKAWFSIQILVAFTIYLEAVGLAPQLWLMRRMVEIESMTSVYVALLVLSRVFRLLFWLSLYRLGEHFIGLFVADAIHCLLSADYLVQWFRRLRHGSLIKLHGM